MKKYDIVFVTAHPDDAFLMAGGTILYSIANGKSVYIITVTDGANGNEQQGDIRRHEFREALSKSGADGQILDFDDGILSYCEKDLFLTLFPLLLELDPILIIGHGEFDYHPDHRAVSHVLDTTVSAIWHKSGTHRLNHFYCMPPAVLTTHIIRLLPYDVISVISGYEKEKEELISTHRSQFPNLGLRIKQHALFSSFLGSISGQNTVESFYSHQNTLKAVGQKAILLSDVL